VFVFGCNRKAFKSESSALFNSRRLISFASFLFTFSGAAAGQAPGTGGITGRVLDPSNAAVANASVGVICDVGDTSRTTKTSLEGNYNFPLLPPGTCAITVQAPGFAKETVSQIVVTVSETDVQDIHLVLSSQSSTIKVLATTDVAQTENAALGRVVTEQQIVALPLANRNFTQILGLSPGVEVDLFDAGQYGRNSQDISSAGANTTQNNFQFDGIDANNISQNSASGYFAEVGLAIPAPDTIEEFKVQTAQYSAEYGRSIGANVDLVSKSGTSRFHGNAWEFLRNDDLNANNYFLKQTQQPRPVLKQNQFGATLGGPVLKRTRTYFFLSYQGTTQRNGESSGSLATAFLPPLTNDRSRPALGALFGGQAGAFGGATVASDGSNISAAAFTLLNFKLPNGAFAIPIPQTILPSGIGESIYSIPLRFREDQFSTNLDQQVGSSDSVAARYFHSRDETNEPFTPFSADLPGWPNFETDHNDMLVLSETHTFSHTAVNVARFGYMRFHGFVTSGSALSAEQAGIATPSGLPQMPQLDINNFFEIGPAGQPFSFQTTNTFVWQDTLSITRGKHNLTMGFEAKRHQLALNVPYVTTGFLLFQSFPDFLLGESAAQNGSAVSNVFQSVGASGIFAKNERYTDFAGFFQDNFHVSPRLAVDVGLRYEYFGPPSETHGRLSAFDPSIASSQVPDSGSFSGFVVSSNLKANVPAGVLRASDPGYWAPDFKNIGPRIGFAYRLVEKPILVLRAGYGIYYQRLSGDLAEQDVGQPPFAATQMLQGSQNAAATLEQPFVPALPTPSSFPVFIPRTPSSAITIATVDRTMRSPASQSYSIGIQYEISPTLLWEIGYLGSATAHVTGCTQFNQAELATPQRPVNGQTTTTLENVANRVPFEGIAEAAYICGTKFSANYNALQTSLTKRLGNGLSVLASYTWSKSLNYTTQETPAFDAGFMSGDQTNPRQAYGPASYDRPHRLVVSFSYQTPRPKWRAEPLKLALSDWQFSGVLVEQSGAPITVTDSGAGTVFGNLVFTNRPDCTGQNPASAGSVQNRLNGYFNAAAFAPAPTIGDGTGFGNCGVGILRGPGQHNLDLGVARNFPIGERAKVQFIAEFFNFTNTPSFALPVSDRAAGPAFGVISQTIANPRIIQLALKASF
jgi:hypothetical protein